MSEWISVEDRLPDYGENVLVWFGGDSIHAQRQFIVVTHRESTSSAGEHWESIYAHYITHWMLLPEPPRKSFANIECGGCGEIALEYQRTVECAEIKHDEYRCAKCGHEECFNV